MHGGSLTVLDVVCISNTSAHNFKYFTVIICPFTYKIIIQPTVHIFSYY